MGSAPARHSPAMAVVARALALLQLAPRLGLPLLAFVIWASGWDWRSWTLFFAVSLDLSFADCERVQQLISALGKPLGVAPLLAACRRPHRCRRLPPCTLLAGPPPHPPPSHTRVAGFCDIVVPPLAQFLGDYGAVAATLAGFHILWWPLADAALLGASRRRQAVAFASYLWLSFAYWHPIVRACAVVGAAMLRCPSLLQLPAALLARPILPHALLFLMAIERWVASSATEIAALFQPARCTDAALEGLELCQGRFGCWPAAACRHLLYWLQPEVGDVAETLGHMPCCGSAGQCLLPPQARAALQITPSHSATAHLQAAPPLPYPLPCEVEVYLCLARADVAVGFRTGKLVWRCMAVGTCHCWRADGLAASSQAARQPRVLAAGATANIYAAPMRNRSWLNISETSLPPFAAACSPMPGPMPSPRLRVACVSGPGPAWPPAQVAPAT